MSAYLNVVGDHLAVDLDGQRGLRVARGDGGERVGGGRRVLRHQRAPDIGLAAARARNAVQDHFKHVRDGVLPDLWETARQQR